MDDINLAIDFDVTDDLIELYSHSTGDEFVGEKDGPLDLEQAAAALNKIVLTGLYGKYPRLGIMKIYLGDKLVGFSMPRAVVKDEHEWFKLPTSLDYYRIGTVFIDPHYRCRGIMKAVIKQFIATYSYVVWTCDVNNTGSAKSALSAGLELKHLLYFNKEKKWFFEHNEDCVRTSLVYAN